MSGNKVQHKFAMNSPEQRRDTLPFYIEISIWIRAANFYAMANPVPPGQACVLPLFTPRLQIWP
jgi:hypothetical protein